MRIRISPLDKVFSQFIRMRAIQRVHGCEKCLTYKEDYKQLENSHFFGRVRKSVRWDEDNCAGLCFRCHQHLDSQHLEFVRWFESHIGKEAMEMLEGRERVMGKPDKAMLMIYYQDKIRQMED